MTKFISNSGATENYNFIEKPSKIRWDKEIAFKFENLLQNPDSKNFIKNFVKNGIAKEQTGVDSATAFLSDFIINAAINAGIDGNQLEFKFPKKSPHPNWKFKKKKSRKKVMPKWHDATCESVLKQINQTSLLVKKYPKNQYLKT